jgi:hypothetical protein
MRGEKSFSGTWQNTTNSKAVSLVGTSSMEVETLTEDGVTETIHTMIEGVEPDFDISVPMEKRSTLSSLGWTAEDFGEEAKLVWSIVENGQWASEQTESVSTSVG